MGDYEHSITVAVEPDRLYAYLSDVGNLPRYMNSMRSAEPAGNDAVHTVAEVDGTRVEGEAWFRADEAARSIAWGSEGESDYHGTLVVVPDGSGATVTVALHTVHTDEPRIADGLRATLETIKHNVEDGADPVAPS